MNAEEIITVERKEDLATIRTPKVFYPKSKHYFVSFQDRDDFDEKDEDLTESEDNNKIKMRSSDIHKIMKMAGIPNRKLSTYILYLLTLVETEYIQSIPNEKKEYKIDYKMMTKIIKHFYVLVNKDEEDDDGIKISRDSLLKIFDLLRLSIKDRLKLMEFYEVETDEISNENIRERDIFKSPLNQLDKPKSSNNPRDKFKTPKTRERNGTKPFPNKRDIPTKSPDKSNKIINISRERIEKERYRSSLESQPHEDGRKRLRKKGKRNDKMLPENIIDEDFNNDDEEGVEEDDINAGGMKPKKGKGLEKKKNNMNKAGKPRDKDNDNRNNEDNDDERNEDEIERSEGRRKGPKKLNKRRKEVNDEFGEDGNEEGEEDEELEGDDDLKRNYPRGKGGKNKNRGRGKKERSKPNKFEDEEEDELDDNAPKNKRKGKISPDDYDIDDNINLRKGIRKGDKYDRRNDFEDNDSNEHLDDSRNNALRGKGNKRGKPGRNNYEDEEDEDNVPRGKGRGRKDVYDEENDDNLSNKGKRGPGRNRSRDKGDNDKEYDDNDDYNNRGPRGRGKDSRGGRKNNYGEDDNDNDDYKNNMPNRDRKGKPRDGRDYYDNDSEGDYKRNQPKGRNKSGDRDGRRGYDDDNNNDNRDDYDTKNLPRGAQNKGRPNQFRNNDNDFNDNYPRGRGEDRYSGRPNNYDDDRNNQRGPGRGRGGDNFNDYEGNFDNNNSPRRGGRDGNRGKPNNFGGNEDYDYRDSYPRRDGPGKRGNFEDDEKEGDYNNIPNDMGRNSNKSRQNPYGNENDNGDNLPRGRGKDGQNDYNNNLPQDMGRNRGKPNNLYGPNYNEEGNDFGGNQPRNYNNKFGRNNLGDNDGNNNYLPREKGVDKGKPNYYDTEDMNSKEGDYDNNLPRGTGVNQNKRRPNQFGNEDNYNNDFNNNYPRGRGQDGYSGRPNNFEDDKNNDFNNNNLPREGRNDFGDDFAEKGKDNNNAPRETGVSPTRERPDKYSVGKGKGGNIFGNNDYNNNLPIGEGENINDGRPNQFGNQDENNNNLPRGGRKDDIRDKNNILGNEIMKEPADEFNKFSPKGKDKNNDNKRPSNVSNEGVDEFDQVLSDNLPRGASKLKNSLHKSSNLDNPQIEEEKNLNKPKQNNDEEDNNLPIGKERGNKFGNEDDDKDNGVPGRKGKGSKNKILSGENDDEDDTNNKIPKDAGRSKDKSNPNEYDEENPNGEDLDDTKNNKKPLKSPTKLSKYKTTYEKLKEKITKSIVSNDLDDDDDSNKKDNDDNKKDKGPKSKNRPNDDDNLEDNGSEGVPELNKGNKKKGNKPPSKKGKNDDLDNIDNPDNDNPEEESIPGLDKNKKPKKGASPRKGKGKNGDDDNEDENEPGNGSKKPKKEGNDDDVNEDSDEGLPLKDSKNKPKGKKFKDDGEGQTNSNEDENNPSEDSDIKKAGSKKGAPKKKPTKSKDKRRPSKSSKGTKEGEEGGEDTTKDNKKPKTPFKDANGDDSNGEELSGDDKKPKKTPGRKGLNKNRKPDNEDNNDDMTDEEKEKDEDDLPKGKDKDNKDNESEPEENKVDMSEPSPKAGKEPKRKDPKKKGNKRNKSKPSLGEDENEPDSFIKTKISKSRERLLKRINNYEIDEPIDDGSERESKGNKRPSRSRGSANTDELNNEDSNNDNPLDRDEPNKDNRQRPKKKIIKKKIPKKKGPLSGEDDKPKSKKPKDRKGKSRDRKLKPEDRPRSKKDKLVPKDENDSEKGNETDKSPLGSEIDHYKYEAEEIDIEITEEILRKIPENKKHDVPESASEIEVGSESFVVPYVDPREHHKRKKSDIGVETGPMEPVNLRQPPPKPKLRSRPSHHFRGSIDANTCLYHFIHRKKQEYGNWPMYLVGNLPQLGNDNIKNAIKMDEEERNGQKFYSKYVPIKDDKFPFRYRYFLNKNGQIEWLTAPDTYIAHKQFFTLLQNLRNNVISIFDLNIRYLNNVDEQNIWDLRKDQLVQVILNAGPDVLFFQEITKIQFEFIDDNLGSVYDFVGMYRDSTDRSEKCSISYNKFKYTLNDWGQFWLSSTPSVPGSNDFCNFFPRICTWCSLKQLEGLDFAFFNIHLDHVTFEAHMPCIEVALEQMNEVLSKFPETQAVFFGGCFYCEEDDPVIDKVKSHGFILVPIENTFHDFAGDADRHWDYLFWKPYAKIGDTTFRFSHSVVDKPGSTINRAKQQYISDHYPYYAEFEIKGSKFDNQSEASEPSNQSNQSEED